MSRVVVSIPGSTIEAACWNCKHRGRRSGDKYQDEPLTHFARCLLPKPKVDEKGKKKGASRLIGRTRAIASTYGWSGRTPCHIYTGPDYFCRHWEIRDP
jgi:hypothetical protein